MRRQRSFLALLVAYVDIASSLSFQIVPRDSPYQLQKLQLFSSRREWLLSSSAAAVATVLGGSGAASASTSAAEVDVLSPKLRRYTALAPLGPSSTYPPESKTTGLSLSELASLLTRDLTVGSRGRGGYFVTGDLTPEIFRDDCVFVDPTNSVSSLSRYQRALRILFDPDESTVELILPLTVDEESRTITGRIRGRGVLQLPWRPRIASYENKITYSVGEDGLISEQRQVWDTAASEALGETFTPAVLAPPLSAVARPKDEPAEVTELFELVNGHRPDSYSFSQRERIDGLIESVVGRRYGWRSDLLPGRWALAYLQAGPDGGGVDRRIPFPDLWFNNQYQIFGRESVTNVGELLGPLMEVRVSGTLNEQDPGVVDVPKRFRANIDGGRLCLGRGEAVPCAPLPIRGEGLFDGVYLGERVRIGQNLNGGGARVVQVRIE